MVDPKPSYKEKNGTTRVGDSLRWLVDKGSIVAPELLDIAANITGVNALSVLGDKISGSTDFSETDKKMLLAEIELDKIEMQEITKRWQADMESDSWASKNIRPYATAGTLVFTFIVMILDSAIKSFKVEDHWVNLLVTLLSLMVVALFGSRGYEKIKGVAGKVKGK
jgi:hypothetical protein